MTSEATFVGGPIDGAIRAFPADPPPWEVEFVAMGDTKGLGPNDPIPTVTHTYRRQVSRADEGPLWVMVYRGAR